MITRALCSSVQKTSCFIPKQSCRWASLGSTIYKGIRRDTREELSPSRLSYRNRRDQFTYSEPNTYSPVPEYTRRTIPKVNLDSEWIYGTSVVEAALKSRRRTLFRFYVYAGDNRTSISKDRDIKLKNLARGQNIDVHEVTDVGMLDSMSSSRPHNGYVLEASALLKTPILSLSPISHDRTTFSYQKAQHDITNSGIILNDLPSTLPNRDPPRYPFILMLDEILDPGNLGAMLRSAYYLGCSAVLVSERNCAPLSPTCLKSSAGAAEYIPILTQTSPSRFIVNSQKAGWRFFAAVPPLRGNRSQSRKGRHVRAEDEDVRKALREAPTVLVMGGEGEGLRDTLSKACDRFVSIGNANDVDRGVDSLNVSVAAGVLCQAFLGKR